MKIQAVLGILDKVGVSGYTIIKDIDGQGDRGRASNDLENTALSNGYVISVCTHEQELKIVECMYCF